MIKLVDVHFVKMKPLCIYVRTLDMFTHNGTQINVKTILNNKLLFSKADLIYTG